MPIDDIPGTDPDDLLGHDGQRQIEGKSIFTANKESTKRRSYTTSGSEATAGSFNIYLGVLPAGALVEGFYLEHDALVGTGTATMTLGVVGAETALYSTPIDITAAGTLRERAPALLSAETDRYLVARITHTTGTWTTGSTFRILYSTREPQLLTIRGGIGVSPPLSVETPLGRQQIPLPPGDPDQPPTVTLTVPTSVNEGDTIPLVATAVDPEGQSMTYRWATTGVVPGGVSITSPLSAVASASTGQYQESQVVTFICDVTDAAGNRVQETASCTIAATNSPPVVVMSPNITGAGDGTNVFLTAQVTDPEGFPVSVTWSQTGGPSGANILSPANPQTLVALPAGNEGATFTFRISASDGVDATTGTISVTVAEAMGAGGGPGTMPAGLEGTGNLDPSAGSVWLSYDHTASEQIPEGLAARDPVRIKVEGDPYRGKYSDGTWWVQSGAKVIDIDPECVTGGGPSGSTEHGAHMNLEVGSTNGFASYLTNASSSYSAGQNEAAKAVTGDALSIVGSVGDCLVASRTHDDNSWGSTGFAGGVLDYCPLHFVDVNETGANGNYLTQSTSTWYRPACIGPNPGSVNREVHKLSDHVLQPLALSTPPGVTVEAWPDRPSCWSGQHVYMRFTDEPSAANWVAMGLTPMADLDGYGEKTASLYCNLIFHANLAANSPTRRLELMQRAIQLGIDAEAQVDGQAVWSGDGGISPYGIGFCMAFKRAFLGQPVRDWFCYDSAQWLAETGETAPNNELPTYPGAPGANPDARQPIYFPELSRFCYVPSEQPPVSGAHDTLDVNSPSYSNANAGCHWKTPRTSRSGWNNDADYGTNYEYLMTYSYGVMLVIRMLGIEQYVWADYDGNRTSIAAGGDGDWAYLDMFEMRTRCIDTQARASAGGGNMGSFGWWYRASGSAQGGGNSHGGLSDMPYEPVSVGREFWYFHRPSAAGQPFWGNWNDRTGLVGHPTYKNWVHPSTRIAGNSAPVSNAGPNQTEEYPATITLDGSGSSDADGSIAAYEWTQVGGPSVSLDDNTIAGPQFTAADPGAVTDTYLFNLKVTDNDGATNTDQVQITINPTGVPGGTSDFVWNGNASSEGMFAPATVFGVDGFTSTGHHTGSGDPVEGAVSIVNASQVAETNYEVLWTVQPESADLNHGNLVFWVCMNDADQTTLPDDLTGYSFAINAFNETGSWDKDGVALAGGGTTSQSAVWSNSTNAWYVRARVESGVGETTLRVRFWESGNPEPADWVHAVTDSSTPYQSGGVGMYVNHAPVFGTKTVDWAVEINNADSSYEQAGNSYS